MYTITIITSTVLKEDTDACEITAMERKKISNFVTDNFSFRKKSKIKKKDHETAQVKMMAASYADAVNSLHMSEMHLSNILMY